MEDSVTISLEKYESIKQKNKDFELFVDEMFEIFWDLATDTQYHDLVQKKLTDKGIRIDHYDGCMVRYIGQGRKIYTSRK